MTSTGKTRTWGIHLWVVHASLSVSSYCDQLKVSESTHVLQPFLPSILDGLIHLAAQFSSEVLNLVMETLCIVCTVDPEFTASMESKICPFTIAIFLKYSNGMPPGLRVDEGPQREGCGWGVYVKLSPGSDGLKHHKQRMAFTQQRGEPCWYSGAWKSRVPIPVTLTCSQNWGKKTMSKGLTGKRCTSEL